MQKNQKNKDSIESIDINDAISVSEKLSKMTEGSLLTKEDVNLLKQAVKLINLLVTIYGMWKKSKKRISSLLKMLFGKRSEKLKDLGNGKSGTGSTAGSGRQDTSGQGEGTGSGQDQNNSAEDAEQSQSGGNDGQGNQADENNSGNDDDKKRNGGGGKNSADDYTAAVEIECKLDDDKLPGKICPECNDNKLYEIDPKKVIRLVGNAPVTAFKFILQQSCY